MTSTRRRTAVAAAVAALVGGAVGITGTSLALWSDSTQVTGAIATGYEAFAVGSPGATLAADSGAAVFTLGRDVAEALVRDGEVAVPIQVDSLSQGNKGLRYELTPPAGWGANVLGAADISVFRVANTDRCSVDDLSREDVPSAGPLTSTPVAASYSTGTDPVVEYWCVYAAFDGPPVLGTYENTASVTATSPTGDQVGDEDTWDAVVVADLDPAAEPDHDIAFTYTTFRPGEDL